MDLQKQGRARFFMAEDNPGDVTLMREAINEVGLPVDLEVATDGASAVAAPSTRRINHQISSF